MGKRRGSRRKEPARTITPAKTNPKPLAAFDLGFYGMEIWTWLVVHWEMPDYEGTPDSVPLAADMLGEARYHLASELSSNIFQELPEILEKFQELNEGLAEAFQSGRLGSNERLPLEPPGRDLWRKLRSLLDAALGRRLPLRPFYDLGSALGGLQVELRSLQNTSNSLDDFDELPAIWSVVDASRRLPRKLLQHLPLLESFVQTTPVLEQSGQFEFVEQYYTESIDPWSWHNELDLFTIIRMFRDLAKFVQEDLETLTIADWDYETAPSDPGNEPFDSSSDRPYWDCEKGVLRYRGQVIREVRPIAQNVICVLDTFQEESWTRHIDDPLPGSSESQPARLHDTLASLNGKLAPGTIRFSADGTGKGICWSAATDE